MRMLSPTASGTSAMLTVRARNGRNTFAPASTRGEADRLARSGLPMEQPDENALAAHVAGHGGHDCGARLRRRRAAGGHVEGGIEREEGADAPS